MRIVKYSFIIIVSLLLGCKTTQIEGGFSNYLLTAEGNTADDATKLYGAITELISGEPVMFATVIIYQEGQLIAGVETDFDGHYSFVLATQTDTMLLVLESSYLGMKTASIDAFPLSSGTLTRLDIQMENNDVSLQYPFCPFWTIPLIEQDNMTSGQTFTSEQIRRSGVRSN